MRYLLVCFSLVPNVFYLSHTVKNDKPFRFVVFSVLVRQNTLELRSLFIINKVFEVITSSGISCFSITKLKKMNKLFFQTLFCLKSKV